MRERGRIEAIDLYQGVNYTPSIIIGDNVAMGNDVHIGVIGQLKIGNNVLLGSHIFISDHSHGKLNKTDIKKVAIERRLYSKGNIIIEDKDWTKQCNWCKYSCYKRCTSKFNCCRKSRSSDSPN